MSNPCPTSDEQAATTSGGALSVWLLAISAFVIVTTEFLIVGLLPALARDLDVSIAAAGWLITLFAFTVMLAGPVLTSMVAHLDHKKLFVAILLIFSGSNALAAMSGNIWILAVARFIPALALPVFWGTASETAAEIAGPQKAAKAVANVYMGIAAAMVLGVPLGTLVGAAVGWRGAFIGLAALSLTMAALLHGVMPGLARPKKLAIASQMRILKDPALLTQLGLSVLVFTAMFTAYTYLADLLEQAAGVPPGHVGWWLMGFGVVGLAGNWLGGVFGGDDPLRATAVGVTLLAVGMSLSSMLVQNHAGLMVALAIWGVANTALYPICQIRVMRAAAQAQALAGTLNVSMANAGIGLGAIIGGVAIQTLGVQSTGYVAAMIGGLAIVCTLLTAILQCRREAEQTSR